MTLPKQIQSLSEDRCAVAPYNFVELPDQIVEVSAKDLPTNDRYHIDDHLTGRIECTLTTESPLYIRCGMTPEDYADWGDLSNDKLTPAQRERKADFFSLSGQPVLPGSSLRGMLRSVIEIITWSKLSKVSGQSLVYRAIADGSILRDTYHKSINQGGSRQAGFMICDKGIWKIQPALPIADSEDITLARIKKTEIKGENRSKRWHNSKNSYKINVEINSNSIEDDDNGFKYPLANQTQTLEDSSKPIKRPHNAVLVESGKIPGKEKEHIFGLPDPNTDNWLEIPNDLLLSYKNQITKEQINLLGESGLLQDHQPVFYAIDNNRIIFFGHTLMFRLPYEFSIKDFIPQNLRQEENLDISEALFGTVLNHKSNNGEQQSILGRITVSDAYCQQKHDFWFEDGNHMITPQILSGPKPTTFQHYLVQTHESAQKLKHYGSQPITETVIRGHKLYWHKGNVAKNDISAPEAGNPNDTQHTRIKPIKPNVSFKFSIDFRNLKDYELGALAWVLNIAQDPQYRLSLGMGKPLGMGAVKITHQIHISNRSQRYHSLFDNNDQWEVSEEILDSANYINIFEKYIVDKVQTSNDFKSLSRVKNLLRLLTWEADISLQDKNRRRYMRLEEFRSRKILPPPQRVSTEEVKLSDGDIISATISYIEIKPGTKSKITLRYIHEGSQLSGKEEIYKFEDKGIELKEGNKVSLQGTELKEGSNISLQVITIKDGVIKKYKLVLKDL